MIHRHQNSLWPLLAEDRISAMLILDGEHLPDDAIVAMVRAKSAAGIIITSDAAPVAGLDDGNYSWGSTNVRVCSGRVRHSTLPCLAGSGALMLQYESPRADKNVEAWMAALARRADASGLPKSTAGAPFSI